MALNHKKIILLCIIILCGFPLSSQSKGEILHTSIGQDQVIESNAYISYIGEKKYNDLVIKYARKYSVSYDLIDGILDCENVLRDPTLQSNLFYNFSRPELGIYINEREYSFGLAQINLHYNPKISHSQATDPDFSIDFLAKNLARGNGSWWACYSKTLTAM